MPAPTSTLLTLILTLSLPLKPVSAWTFIWHNATNASFIEHGTSSQPCKAIDHAQGHEFSWDPDDSIGYCLSLFRDDKCASQAGYTCAAWDKNASLTLLSFDVEVQGVSSSLASASSTSTLSSVSLATSSITSGTTTTPTSSQSSNAVPPQQSNSSHLSGGAIAGITIGCVVGVSAIAGLLWFFYSRKHAGGNPPSAPPAPPPPQGAPDGTVAMSDSAVATGSGIGAYDAEKKTVPGSSHSYNMQLVQQHEMPGESRPTELSDAGTLHELDASTRR
jgi:hypothetical protein